MSRQFLAKHFKECEYVATVILDNHFVKSDYVGNKFITTSDSIFADPFDPTTDANIKRFTEESEYIDEAMNILTKFDKSMTSTQRMDLIKQVIEKCDV